jgi:hypothetical protein
MTSANVCEKCGQAIPVFDDVTDGARARVFALIHEDCTRMAAQELVEAVSCSAPDAELWISHRGCGVRWLAVPEMSRAVD